MLFLKIFIWIVALSLSALLSAIAPTAGETKVTESVYHDNVAACVFLSFMLLLVAFGAIIGIMVPLSWSLWVKDVVGLAWIALTIFLQQKIKNSFKI